MIASTSASSSVEPLHAGAHRRSDPAKDHQDASGRGLPRRPASPTLLMRLSSMERGGELLDQSRALAATIVTCTYNGARRIVPTIEAIAGQQLPDRAFEWIVVDNNSTDGTGKLVDGHPAVRALRERSCVVRVVVEPRLGLSSARLRGAREASSPLVAFVDDDNVPDPTYLAEGVREFETHPELGVLVARVRPVYEVAPPPSLRRREHLLAVNDRLGDQRLELDGAGTLPPTVGAGLWVRRDAFLRAFASERGWMMSDRTGSALVSGGDIEIGLLLRASGWRCVYSPSVRIAHHIPATRCRTSYVMRLIAGIVRSELTLKARHDASFRPTLERVKSCFRFLWALLASPVLACTRVDGPREVLFVLASRLASVLGPFSESADHRQGRASSRT